MKRIIFIILLVLNFFEISAQNTADNIYTITVFGEIGLGKEACGKTHGLQAIKLFFESGDEHYIFGNAPYPGKEWKWSNKMFSSTLYEFKGDNKVTHVEFYSHVRSNNLGGCGSIDYHDRQKIPIANITGYSRKDYTYNEVFPSHTKGRKGYASIIITPKPNIRFSDPDADITSNYTICKSDAVDITASSGFTPKNVIYTWDFLDLVNTKQVRPPELEELIKKRNTAESNLKTCKELNPNDWEKRCFRQKQEYDEANAAYNEYINDPTKPEWITVPYGWRPITDTSIDGKANISLALNNLYPNKGDQDTAVNKPIRVRVNPSCNIHDNDASNILTIVYMPDLPKMTMVTPKNPSCATTNDGEFTITFNRPLNSNERINLSLEKINPLGEYDPHSVAGVNKTNMPGTTFVWGNIEKGDYRVTFTGGKIGPEDVAYCHDDNSEEFTITSPPEIKFDATPTHPKCYVDKGKIVINVTSGSANQYSLDGTNWTGFKGSGVTIEDLPPATYTVWVSKNGNCAVSKTDITINKAIQIQHEEGDITPPGAPDAEDARISVKRVWGGTPKTDGGGSYYDATIFINGSSTNTKTQRAGANGFDIMNLPKGTHEIEYTDANNCKQRYTFTKIEDPLPIQFKIKKQDPSCSGAADGILEVIDLIGGYPSRTITWKKNGNAYGVGASIKGSQGNYDVVITDNRSGRAEQTGIKFDNVPLPITITDINIQPILCNGDKAKVTITATGGGSGSYQYAVWTGATTSVWQDSNVFALDANTMPGYRFRVRDRNATDCDSDISGRQLIDQPTKIDIETVKVVHNKVFNDNKGAIEINVTGGKPNYTIIWEKGGTLVSNTGTSISDLKAGDYVAIVKDDNGCEVKSVVIPVEEPDQLIVSINEEIPIPCYDGVGTLKADVKGGSLSYTYQWYKDGKPITGEESNTLSGIEAGKYSVKVEDGYTFVDTSKDFEEPKELILTIDKTENVSCFSGKDGKIITKPQGGTRPYYFSIDDKKTYVSEDDLTNLTIEGLEAISYTIWLKDANGCEVSTPQTVKLTSPDEIIITKKSIVHATTVDGTNGSVTLEDVIGGVGTYTYSWSKQGDTSFIKTTRDIDNLSYGIYTILVQDTNSCVVEKTFEVKQPLPMFVKMEIENPILCHDDALGELVATVEGGYPIESTPEDFEYRWYKIESSGDVPINTDLTLDRLERLKAGKYKVVTNDSQGTTAEATIDLTQPEDLVVKLSSASTKILCYGDTTGAIDITVEGGPKDPGTGAYLPYTYRWTKVEDPDFEATTEDLQNMPAGTYEVVVIDDNLCTTSLSEAITIEQPDAALEIYDVVTVNLTGFKAGDGSISLEVKGGTTPFSYAWKNLDDPLYTASSQDINGLQIGRYELVVTDANACSVSITREITEPNQLIVAIVPLSEDEGVQCYGEDTVVPLSTTTQGGIGDYTYQWYEQKDPTDILFTTPQTTVVGAGTYTVIVTDANGNTHDDTYTVGEPEVLEINQNVTHLLCRGDANGSIDITVKGGVQPYSYRWSTGENSEDLSSLQAGNYKITVTDANNCIITKTIEINQPPGLFVNGDIIRVNPSSSGARDGSITVNIAGGTPSYRYEWRDSGNVLQSSTTNVLSNIGSEKYSLTVIDANGCSLHIPDVDVYDPPILKVEVKQVNVILCNGDATGSLNARAEGGTPFSGAKQYTYQWFDADENSIVGSDSFLLEGITEGNYYVIVTDAMGIKVTSADFSLTEPKELGLELDVDFKNCGDGEDWVIIAQVDGGTGPYNYLWNTGNTGDRIENVVGGTYSVEVTDKRGCYVTNQTITIAPEALDVNHSQTIPTCYEGCDGTIILETLGGTAPYNYQWSNGQTGKNLTNICAGTYSVRITDAKGCQITREYVLDNPAALLVDIGEDVTLCKDQSIVLDATITDPDATYLWTSENEYSSTDAVIEVSESSIYQVVVTDSKGCVGSDSIFIDSSTEDITANFFASTQVFVGEKFVIVDNSDPIPDNVDWIFPEEAVVTYEDDNYAEAIFETPGEYEITLQTYRGLCTAMTTKTVIVVEKEIENDGEGEENPDIQSFIDYLVYPNPTTDGRFKIEVDLQKSQPISVKIFNMINNTLIDSKSGEGNDTYTFDYDMSILPSGIYFVLLETSSASQVRKLVIE
ncbi:T9SS type A sorting domain-containing protein [Aquimarina megaterium]|uniref:T9SS type A sorting domain-containing protein n=1 Tax=Aquimarina megaterium TaxID=1443666 RepID=UPI0009436C71|nr:T9SS type A sorting domain-containing protein [Aquimarina megaterium]